MLETQPHGLAITVCEKILKKANTAQKLELTLRQSLKPATVTKVPKVSSLPIGNWNVKVHRPLSEKMKKNQNQTSIS